MKKIIASAILALGLAGSAHASIVVADNFNANAADQLNGTPTGWTLVNGSVDIIGAGGGFDWYPGNGSYIDMDGSQGALGQNSMIMTMASFFMKANKIFTVNFDYGINHNDGSDTDLITFGAYVPSTNSFFDLLTVDAGALNHNSNLFTAAAVGFFATGDLFAKFYFKGTSVGPSDQSGGLLDNVQISSVPLPGAALLLASGLLGLGGASRLRRKKA